MEIKLGNTFQICFILSIMSLLTVPMKATFLTEEEIKNHQKNHLDLYENSNNDEEVKKISNNNNSFSIWDDIAALGLWFIILMIFGPTAIVAILAYICCKNICLRNNASPLLP